MAVIKKTQLASMTMEERSAKISELERAILELRGEGKREKVKPLKKAIAKLRTPPAPKKGPVPGKVTKSVK
ncbi:MAG: hypothetical protein AB1324_08380 [Candidatus Micrarchaeota archaeon]